MILNNKSSAFWILVDNLKDPVHFFKTVDATLENVPDETSNTITTTDRIRRRPPLVPVPRGNSFNIIVSHADALLKLNWICRFRLCAILLERPRCTSTSLHPGATRYRRIEAIPFYDPADDSNSYDVRNRIVKTPVPGINRLACNSNSVHASVVAAINTTRRKRSNTM